MARILSVLALFLFIPTSAAAQDMPLSQILIDSEGWKKVEGKSEKPKGVEIRFAFLRGEGSPGWYELTLPSGKKFGVGGFHGISKTVNPAPFDQPAAALLTPEGSARYIGGGAQQHLWAYRVDKEGKLGARDRYAPLRVKRGEHTIAVTALATDKDGRIYAATELGIQVFDPTGRLCGVMTVPEGKAEVMAFEGDKLTLWIGDTKYARKLNTQGAK